MFYRNTLKAAVAAAACLASLNAFADDQQQQNNEVGIGLMGVWGTNANQAGRYNGINTNGVDFVGDFSCHARPPGDSGGTYFDAVGTNLILQGGSATYAPTSSNRLANNGSLSFGFGRRGTWEGGLTYDAITYTGNLIDSLYTVNGGQANLNTPLTPYGGATATSAGSVTKPTLTVPVLTASGAMQPVQTGTRRDIMGGNFKYFYGDWTFTGALRHEQKDGSMEEAFFGPWGGTAFALPIDYTTDRYDAAAAYTTRENQVSLLYTFSRFHDGNSFVALPYPFSNTAVPYQLAAAYSTPPSSSAHYLTLMAATNAVANTRINLNLRGGLELQDDTFAPNAANPNPAGTPGLGNLTPAFQGTSANSLDARAKILQGKLSVYSRPMPEADINAYYGYDRRTVSQNQYQVFTGGTGGENDANFTSSSFSVPQEWRKQNAGIDAGYRIDPKSDTKVTVGYRYDDVNRTNAVVTDSHTNTLSAVLLSRLGDKSYGRISYQHEDRSGSLNFLTPWASLDGTQNASVDYSGAYYQAPMKADSVRLTGDYMASELTSADLFVQYRKESFDYGSAPVIGSNVPPLTGQAGGVKEDSNVTVSPSINFRPRDDVLLHVFYTYERIYFNNIGNGACSTAAQAATAACLGSAGYFQNKYTSDVNTVGLSGNWKVSDAMKVSLEYNFAYGSVMFGQYNGVFVSNPTQSYQNVTNYPDISSRMHNLVLTADYKLSPQTDMLFRAMWSYYKDDNWYDTASSIQGAGTTAVSILTPGYGSPYYNVGAVLVGVRMRF